MAQQDDDLKIFEADGAAPLPPSTDEGHVAHDGANIWYACFGAGPPVILLHGGLGHSGNWGHQVPALLAAGRRVVLIDSRGHGRSTRDKRPYTYERMASDVIAVMDALKIERAPFVGWSDGACIAMIVGMKHPARAERVLFFGCNMDPSGTKEIKPNPVLGRCLNRHFADYKALSATPTKFRAFADAISAMMAKQPNYKAADLAQVQVPVTILHSEGDEFIKTEHAEYLARIIPGAKLVRLEGVTHFAPLQRPEVFNAAMLAFLGA